MVDFATDRVESGTITTIATAVFNKLRPPPSQIAYRYRPGGLKTGRILGGLSEIGHLFWPVTDKMGRHRCSRGL